MTGTGSLAATVAGRVSDLQRGYLADRKSPRAVAALAALRRAVAAPVGSVPEVWDLTTLPWVDDTLPRVTDEPTPEELACHTAMTLYALHQQSKHDPMHVRAGRQDSRSLGVAVARLIAAVDNPQRRADPDRVSSVRRRFNALVTASTFTEMTHHLRGLIMQLRAEGIALDYGRLADDLARLQNPGRADGVRLRWARDLAGPRAVIAEDSASPDSAAPPSSTTGTDPEETP
jgi:CRISPR system Cascade subunit CasB